jgi:hypothetical protein
MLEEEEHMKSFNHLHCQIAASVILCSITAGVHGETLDKSFTAQPFLNTALGGTTVAARPELAGVVLQDDVEPFSFSGISGTVQNRVVRENGTGTLDFYWRIQVDPKFATVAPEAVSAFRLINFGYDEITDADWRIDGLGSAAPSVGRVFNPAFDPEGAINFLFTDSLVQSGSDGSRFFFLHTDATDYAKTASFDLLDGAEDLSPIYETFAPYSGVPDGGSTWCMVLMSLAGLALGVRR